MKKAAFLLMLIMIISKVFGLLRDITLSYFYGASTISDVYLVSITIPSVIFGLIVTGLSTAYIPIYRKIEESSGFEEGLSYTNKLLNLLIMLSTIIVALGLLFTEPLVNIFASGFEGDTLVLAIKFTKISLFGIYFTSLIYIFSAFLQLKNNFTAPALSAIPMNIFTIISVYISNITTSLLLAVGTVIATASQLIYLIPYIYKNGYRYKFTININDNHMKSMFYIALPVILGSSINQLNLIVDRTIASQVVIGGVSTLNYANRLNGFIGGIFVLSISTIMYPIISKMAAEKNIIEFKKTVTESVGVINLLIIPATVGSMIFAEPIVTLLFGRGAFDEQAISTTSKALFFYSVGMIGYGLREVITRAFYSLHNTKTPMLFAGAALLINIVLNIILSKYLGIGGIALATSISDITCTIFLIITLRKNIGSLGLKKVAKSFFKILFASILMGLISKITYLLVIQSGANFSNIALIISILIGAITYFVIVYFMKLDEADVFLNALKLKFKRVAK